MCSVSSKFKLVNVLWNNTTNLGFLCVLSICEVCFYQRFKASVSPLTQVEHEDKKKHKKTDEDSPQSGAQHKHSRPSVCICKDEVQVEFTWEYFAAEKHCQCRCHSLCLTTGCSSDWQVGWSWDAAWVIQHYTSMTLHFKLSGVVS